MEQEKKNRDPELIRVRCSVDGGSMWVRDRVTMKTDAADPRKITVIVETRERYMAKEERHRKKVSPACAAEAQAIIQKHAMKNWADCPFSVDVLFDVPEETISFSYSNGETYRCSSTQDLPEGWRGGFEELKNCLMSHFSGKDKET